MKLIFNLILLILLPIFLSSQTVFKDTVNTAINNIVHIQIQNTISPASASFLKETFKEANKHNATLILIQLDTPGGLATSMREMIQDILNSQIPVVVYVSPKGARAASAGTYLMYSSHIAVMSPGTNIGAATPVNFVSTPKQPINPMDKQNDKEYKKTDIQDKTALEKKVLNDAIAYIKSIAELRGRNIPWAIQAVKEGKSISAQEALRLNVIDLIANDTPDLLQKIDGKKIIINKKVIIINTKNPTLIYFEASWKTKFLMTISNPSIAYIFLIIAMYGILFEMLNPGSIFPGVIGAISALIAMYSLNILPFDYVGLLLIFLGIMFMISEVFITGFGILGIGGLIAFAFGSVLLFDAEILGNAVPIPLIVAFSMVSFGFFIFLFKFFINSRNAKVISGYESMVDSKATIISVTTEGYKVFCHGEIWDATSSEKFKINEEVVVGKINGLTLEIRSLL